MNKKKGIIWNAAEGYFAAFALANIGQIAAVDIISLVLFSDVFSVVSFCGQEGNGKCFVGGWEKAG